MPPMGLHRGTVIGIVADRQQSAMDGGMQGLDPAIHDFGKAGDLAHIADGQPRFGERLACAAGGDEFDAGLGELAGEVDNAALV